MSEQIALYSTVLNPGDAADRARTGDLSVNSRALYQLSYGGMHIFHEDGGI